MKNLFKVLPLLGLGILISCGGKKQETEVTAADAVVKVKTTTARLQSVDQISTYTANVESDIVNQITPAMPGRIEKIYVEIGDRVKAGQLLVQMESSNLQQQSTQLANLEKDYERYTQLLEVGGVSQQTLDQVKMQIDVLKAAIKNIKENTQLLSPIDGVVTARNYDNGNVFAQLPILTVQQLSRLKAVINVSEALFAKVKVGMPVTFKMDVYGDEEFTGKVSLVYPAIDAATHTFGIKVAINPNNRIRPGMYARVSLNLGTSHSIVVPDMAVIKQSGSNDRNVFTVKDGHAKFQKVEVGQRLGDQYEIVSGIVPGQEIVTAGQTRLLDGIAVEVIKN
jgi:RND family efflux transporter MFP subunit